MTDCFNLKHLHALKRKKDDFFLKKACVWQLLTVCRTQPWWLCKSTSSRRYSFLQSCFQIKEVSYLHSCLEKWCCVILLRLHRCASLLFLTSLILGRLWQLSICTRNFLTLKQCSVWLAWIHNLLSQLGHFREIIEMY